MIDIQYSTYIIKFAIIRRKNKMRTFARKLEIKNDSIKRLNLTNIRNSKYKFLLSLATLKPVKETIPYKQRMYRKYRRIAYRRMRFLWFMSHGFKQTNPYSHKVRKFIQYQDNNIESLDYKSKKNKPNIKFSEI